MSTPKGTLKRCRRGHEFYKTSDCPTCPKCWSGTEREKVQSDFPRLAAPALRALASAKITKLAQLARYSETDLRALHGMGPNAIGKLRDALAERGLKFKAG